MRIPIEQVLNYFPAYNWERAEYGYMAYIHYPNIMVVISITYMNGYYFGSVSVDFLQNIIIHENMGVHFSTEDEHCLDTVLQRIWTFLENLKVLGGLV